MNRKAVLLPAMAITGAALAALAVLAGCGGPAAPSAAQSAASHAAVPVSTISHPARPASSSPGRKTQGGNGTRAGTRSASHSTTPPRASSSHGTGSHGTGTMLVEGLYTDGADGTPHYVIALSLGKDDAITGSVNFLYQDGRVGMIGQYTGKLSSNGKLTVVFSDGKGLTGSYAADTLTFTSCRSALPWAIHPNGCRFAYHGHVP